MAVRAHLEALEEERGTATPRASRGPVMLTPRLGSQHAMTPELDSMVAGLMWPHVVWSVAPTQLPSTALMFGVSVVSSEAPRGWRSL